MICPNVHYAKFAAKNKLRLDARFAENTGVSTVNAVTKANAGMIKQNLAKGQNTKNRNRLTDN